jgi:hypothetical protein
MGHTLGDAYIVAAIAAAVVVYLLLKHVERKRRLEIVHQERVAAMEKGIPLPELPLDPARVPRPMDPRVPLLHVIACTALGFGGVAALLIVGPLPNMPTLWPFALPLMFLGIGLILYYVLVSDRRTD